MGDKPLLAAAACLAAVTAVGALVCVREDISGEPLGVSVPGDVTVQLVAGLGAGLSAPWPMPLAALAAALRVDAGKTWPRWVCTAVGCGVIAGTVVEPVTWNRRAASAAARTVVPLNILSGIALAVLGWRSTRVEPTSPTSHVLPRTRG